MKSVSEPKAAFGQIPYEVAKAPEADIGTGTTVECTVLHLASLRPPDLVGQFLCDHNRRQVPWA
jgi:hypothetical protein